MIFLIEFSHRLPERHLGSKFDDFSHHENQGDILTEWETFFRFWRKSQNNTLQHTCRATVHFLVATNHAEARLREARRGQARLHEARRGYADEPSPFQKATLHTRKYQRLAGADRPQLPQIIIV